MKSLKPYTGLFLSCIFAVFLNSPCLFATGKISLLDESEHCVAYLAYKRMFLIKTVKVIGKNCDISSQVIPVLDEKFYFEVEIPILAFKSGEKERDKDVYKLLKAEEKSDLVFRSSAKSAKKWQKLLNNKEFILKGQLLVAGKKFPVKARSILLKTKDGFIADGVIESSFSHFQLKAPSMLVGLFAKVKDKLELHFHLDSEKTLGVDSILPQKAANSSDSN